MMGYAGFNLETKWQLTTTNMTGHLYCDIIRNMKAYVVTNKISGKMYVGITARSLRRRWVEHLQESVRGRTNSALHAAIRKYGAEAFEIKECGIAENWEALCALEIRLIGEMKTLAPVGYNMTKGGDGVVGLPSEKRAEIANKLRGRKHTEEAKRKIGEASKGRPTSQKTKALLSSAHKGKKLTDAHKEKLSAAKIGKSLKPRTAIHSLRISEGLRRAWERKSKGE